MCAQASRMHVHACAHLCVYVGVCMDVCQFACACVCEYACNTGYSINSVSMMSIIASRTSEALMAMRSTQQNHSSKTNNTATTTRSVSPMNRGVRVGVASTTDEPKKHPRHNNMILLLINTYNLRPVKSLFSTDRYAYAKCSLFRLWEPQPPDSSAESGAAIAPRQVRHSRPESCRSGPKFHRVS